MHDKTGIVGIHSSSLDFPQMKIQYAARIWSLCVHHTSFEQYGEPGNADPIRVVTNMKRMIYTIENQRFPDDNLFDPLNIDWVEKIYYQNGDNWVDYSKVVDQLAKDYLKQKTS